MTYLSMTKMLSTTAIVAAVAAPAGAQELTFGGFEATFDYNTIDDNSISSFNLDGEIEFTVDQFVLGAGLQSNTFSIDGSDGITISNYFASAGYMPIDGVMVGAEATGTRFAEGGDSDSIGGYGVFAQYATDQFGFAIRYSIPDSDNDDFSAVTYFGQAAVTPDVTVGAIIETVKDVDQTFYMLRADYDAGPIEAEAYYAAVTDVDGSLFGVDVSYQFNNEMRGLAAIQTTTDGFFADATSYEVGGGYQVADSVWVDATIGQITGAGDEDVTRFGLAVSYEIGGQKRLDRAMTAAGKDNFGSGVLGLTPFSSVSNLFLAGS